MGIETAILIAATAVSAGTAIYQGNQQKKQYQAEAQQAVNDSAYQADAYKQKADQIRKQGRVQLGETNAALAASGAKLGEGTALELSRTVQQRAEQDAVAAILSGDRAKSAASEQASIYNKAGSAAQTTGFLKAGSTVLGTAVDYKLGGYKK